MCSLLVKLDEEIGVCLRGGRLWGEISGSKFSCNKLFENPKSLSRCELECMKFKFKSKFELQLCWMIISTFVIY